MGMIRVDGRDGKLMRGWWNKLFFNPELIECLSNVLLVIRLQTGVPTVDVSRLWYLVYRFIQITIMRQRSYKRAFSLNSYSMNGWPRGDF